MFKDKRLMELETRIERLEKAVLGIMRQVNQIEKRISEIEQKYDAYYNELYSARELNTERINEIEREILDIKDAIVVFDRELESKCKSE